MHCQVVIPARLGSQRLPRKALLPLAGKPLLQHTWERARAADLGPLPIVATDDADIAAAARAFGAPVAWTSPAHRCGSERVAEVAARLDAPWIVNVQGDEALLAPDALVRLAERLRAGDAMATPAAPFPDPSRVSDPAWVKVVCDQNDRALYFSRSPIPFVSGAAAAEPLVHLGIYAFRRETLLDVYRREPTPLERSEGLEQLRALEHGVPIRVLRLASGEPGINTIEDLERARARLGGA